MIGQRLSKEREEALIYLMDDDSPVVQKALLQELERLEEVGARLLKKVLRSGNRILEEQARIFLEELQGPDTIKEFIRFINSLNYELETGCLLLNRTVYPNIDTADSCFLLDAIGARCRELFVLPGSTLEKCKVINRVIFHEYGFRPNKENIDDPQNNYLSQVLEYRIGNSITLSILYILVAQRCGLQLEPIILSEHFLAGCFNESETFYIDASVRGAFRSPQEARKLFSFTNSRAGEDFLAPAPVGEVLCHCCQNLSRIYSISGNQIRARLFAGFIQEFEATYRRHANS